MVREFCRNYAFLHHLGIFYTPKICDMGHTAFTSLPNVGMLWIFWPEKSNGFGQYLFFDSRLANSKALDFFGNRLPCDEVPYIERFGGLVVSTLASVTQDRGFAPDRSPRIFFRRKSPQHAFLGKEVKPFAPCRRFAACQRTVEVASYRLNYRIFLSRFRSSITEDSGVA
jgi:hypothetical protein